MKITNHGFLWSSLKNRIIIIIDIFSIFNFSLKRAFSLSHHQNSSYWILLSILNSNKVEVDIYFPKLLRPKDDSNLLFTSKSWILVMLFFFMLLMSTSTLQLTLYLYYFIFYFKNNLHSSLTRVWIIWELISCFNAYKASEGLNLSLKYFAARINSKLKSVKNWQLLINNS